jgi:hypothetical protein
VSVVKDEALEPGNVGPNSVVWSLSRNAKVVVIKVVLKVNIEKTQDKANVSESDDGLLIHSYSSSSCVLIVEVVANGT